MNRQRQGPFSAASYKLFCYLLVSVPFLGSKLPVSSAQESTALPSASTVAPATNTAPESGLSPSQKESQFLKPPSSELPELGRQALLQEEPRPRLFQVFSDTQCLYDSNILLTDGEIIETGDDAVSIESLGATFSPHLLRGLGSTLYFRHDIVRYNQFSKFDFDEDTGGLSLSYPVDDLFLLYGGFGAGRYYFRAGGHEFFKFYDTYIGLGRELRLSNRALLTYGYHLDWRPSSPSPLTRIDNALYLGLDFAVMDKLTAQLFYRLRLREYLQVNRTDVDNLVALTLTYAFNDYVSVRVFATYAEDNSNLRVHEYSVFNAGGGLNFSFRF
jgi:hypothetical protein